MLKSLSFAIILSCAATGASALSLTFADNATSLYGTGASGAAEISFAQDGGNVRVTVDVENTTGDVIYGEGATKGYLNAFAFDLVDGVNFVDSSFVAGSYLDTLMFDVGAGGGLGKISVGVADNDKFITGTASDGIYSEGDDTDSFSFLLSGMSAAEMEAAFDAAFNDMADPLAAVMRFQKLDAGKNNDTLLYAPSGSSSGTLAPVPLPAGGCCCWPVAAFWQRRGAAGADGPAPGLQGLRIRGRALRRSAPGSFRGLRRVDGPGAETIFPFRCAFARNLIWRKARAAQSGKSA